MPRSLLARSLEPLVAVSWGVFLVWSVWLAAVWTLGINQQWLGLPISEATGWETGVAAMVEDRPLPPYADLRRAVLVLAQSAEMAWLALALIQLHLGVIATNGVNTARTWMAITALGAFLLAAANRAFGMPFGWMHFTPVLGAQFFGVPVGWFLLWPVMLISARESVLRLRPRAGHLAITFGAAALVLLTLVNLHPVIRDVRVWWIFHAGTIREPATAPWFYWASWFIWPWVLIFLLRERTVSAAAAQRSIRPLVILAALNVAAAAAQIRAFLQ